MEPYRSWIPYCGEAPGPEVWLSRWNLDPVLALALLLTGIALWIPRPPRPLDAPLRRRAGRMAWWLVAVLYVSPLCALSSAFFTVRVVHHMALVLLVAPLLVLGLEPWLRRLPAPLWTCTALSTMTFWIWHAPGPYAAALSSVPVYALMQLSLVASAIAFWLAVRRAPAAAGIAAILAATVQMGLLGALITFAGRPLYPPHFASTLAWGISPLQDQQVAGITMWAPGSVAYLVAALWIGWRWLRADHQAAIGRPA
jgi:putative membrane protein